MLGRLGLRQVRRHAGDLDGVPEHDRGVELLDCPFDEQRRRGHRRRDDQHVDAACAELGSCAHGLLLVLDDPGERDVEPAFEHRLRASARGPHPFDEAVAHVRVEEREARDEQTDADAVRLHARAALA